MVGEAFGHKAPVETFSPMFYLDMTVKAGQRLPLPDGHREMGLYSLEGRFDVVGESYGENQFVYIGTDEAPEFLAESDLRIAILGGEPFTTTSLWILEFRLLVTGADRTGQRGLERRAFPESPR